VWRGRIRGWGEIEIERRKDRKSATGQRQQKQERRRQA
jgi:hypothetical protein